jgi:hypothetical protein
MIPLNGSVVILLGLCALNASIAGAAVVGNEKVSAVQKHEILASKDLLVTSPACFSGSTMVTIRNDGTSKKKDRAIPMKDLRIGDYVHSSDGFSRVFSFGHFDSGGLETEYDLLQIHAKGSRKPLEISRAHMIYIVGKENFDDEGSLAAEVCEVEGGDSPPVAASSWKKKLIPAQAVQVGDFVVRLDGILSAVTKIGSIRRSQAYAPFTEAGTLIVNGMLVSNYYLLLPARIQNDDDEDHDQVFSFEMLNWASHMATAPRRLLCQVRWEQCLNEGYTEGGVASWIPFHSLTWALEYSLEMGLIVLLVLLVYLHIRETDTIRELVEM